MKLSSENVHDTFMDCLFKDGEATENHVIGEGVQLKVGLHPERVQNKMQLIIDMLAQLPDSFKASGGGGMSFLNMCQDSDGNQWTDLHNVVDELVCLGSACGMLRFLLPREAWPALPGGMPYIVLQ